MFINKFEIADNIFSTRPTKYIQKISISFFIQALLQNHLKCFFSSVLMTLLIALPYTLKAAPPDLSRLIHRGWYWLIKIDHQCQPILSRLVYVHNHVQPQKTTTKFQVFSIPPLDETKSFQINAVTNAPWRTSNEWSLRKVTFNKSLKFGGHTNILSKFDLQTENKPFPKHPVLKYLTSLEAAHNIANRWTPKELRESIEISIQPKGKAFVKKLFQQGNFQLKTLSLQSRDILYFLKEAMASDADKTKAFYGVDRPPELCPLTEELRNNNFTSCLYDEKDLLDLHDEKVLHEIILYEEKYSDGEPLLPRVLTSPLLGIHSFPLYNGFLAALIPHRHILRFLPGSSKICERHINPACWDIETPRLKQSNYFPTFKNTPSPRFEPLNEIIIEEDTDTEPMDTTVMPQDRKEVKK